MDLYQVLEEMSNANLDMFSEGFADENSEEQ